MAKSLQFFFCGLLLCTHSALSLWDFAVTTNTKILFYDEHWQELTSSAHQFERLLALTFDETEETVYFSDQLHSNGSIFSLKIPTSDENNLNHLIEKVVQRTKNETIAGIAYDPLNRNLYWTDMHNRKIYFAFVYESLAQEPQVLIDFADEETVPDGIAIDVCRRKLYWTNSNFKNASIERIDLDGSNRQVIVRTKLYLPHGIVVDQMSDRIYWVVDQQGVHFSVESAKLDGSDRQTIVRGLNNEPYSLAVTKDAIFWTDLTHNAIWSHAKFNMIQQQQQSNETTIAPIPYMEPHKVRNFASHPHAIVARTRFLSKMQNDQHCAALVATVKSRLLTPQPTRNPADARLERYQRGYCLNGGDYNVERNLCFCNAGYDGARCEISECHNYCVHGTCSISSMGFPQCNCQKGFQGERCQLAKCHRYCQNDGHCRIDDEGAPICECRPNFSGGRCEQNSTEICALFCRLLKHEPDMYVPYGCHDICEVLSEQSGDDAESYAIPRYQHLEVCRNTSVWTNTVIIALVCGVVLCFGLVLLIVHGLRRFYKPARPRIRKTFVVRKQASPSSSDTPLTNRPMATEQCEITIENCCNMNICETPCFDPKLVQQSLSRSTKEDKKILIQNMEDELY